MKNGYIRDSIRVVFSGMIRLSHDQIARIELFRVSLNKTLVKTNIFLF